MDAHLDTFSTELYQVNVCVGYIVRRQVTMGRFALEAIPSPPPPMASGSEDEDDDDGDDDDASNHADAKPMRCLLDILTLCHSRQK